MVKRKTSRKGHSDSLASPREKQTQDAPVTDTVMQVITRRIRNARKKLQKVNVLEELLEKKHTLNEDQERVYMTKAPLTAVIEELLKLEPLVEAALANELEEKMQMAKDQLTKGETSMPTDAQPTSDTGESDGTVEEALREKVEEAQDEASSEGERETMEMPPKAAERSYDDAAEAIYFLQLFAKGRFDLTGFIGGETEGVLTAEEMEMMESFGKRMFETVPHTPQDALESTKEAMHLLFSDTDETSKIYDAVDRLKTSDAMTVELKPTVHGFPIAFDKEESETVTDRSEERTKMEALPSETAPPAEITPPIEENPPPSSPVQPAPQMFVTEDVPMSSKGPRPFLPFPGVALSGGPAMYTVTQTPMMGMHSFFSMAPVSGNYMQPMPYPTPSDVQQEHSEEPPTETQHADDVQEIKDAIEPIQSPTREEDIIPEAADPEPTEEAVASDVPPGGGSQQQPSAIVRPRPGGGRFEGDYRPYQGNRGRYHPSSRGAPRGRGRGRHQSQRRPYDASNPSHRSYPSDRPAYRKRGGYQ